MEEYYSPRKSAEEFIAALFKLRSKRHLAPFMEFLCNRLNEYKSLPLEARNHNNKFACLAAIRSINKEFKSDQVREERAPFIPPS